MKTFVTLFYLGLRDIHLTKDVGLVPYYMHKLFGYKSKIVTPKQSGETYEDLDKYTDGLSIETTKGKKIGFIDFGLIRYLIKNSRKNRYNTYIPFFITDTALLSDIQSM